mmetsp:Transcript_3784/g.5873  ORF Transcript_3784/g.5873 Transcript_3784/m.5873 type:complete len:149 (+) Transcript_3784:138-584(+)
MPKGKKNKTHKSGLTRQISYKAPTASISNKALSGAKVNKKITHTNAFDEQLNELRARAGKFESKGKKSNTELKLGPSVFLQARHNKRRHEDVPTNEESRPDSLNYANSAVEPADLRSTNAYSVFEEPDPSSFVFPLKPSSLLGTSCKK